MNDDALVRALLTADDATAPPPGVPITAAGLAARAAAQTRRRGVTAVAAVLLAAAGFACFGSDAIRSAAQDDETTPRAAAAVDLAVLVARVAELRASLNASAPDRTGAPTPSPAAVRQLRYELADARAAFAPGTPTTDRTPTEDHHR